MASQLEKLVNSLILKGMSRQEAIKKANEMLQSKPRFRGTV